MTLSLRNVLARVIAGELLSAEKIQIEVLPKRPETRGRPIRAERTGRHPLTGLHPFVRIVEAPASCIRKSARLSLTPIWELDAEREQIYVSETCVRRRLRVTPESHHPESHHGWKVYISPGTRRSGANRSSERNRFAESPN